MQDPQGDFAKLAARLNLKKGIDGGTYLHFIVARRSAHLFCSFLDVLGTKCDFDTITKNQAATF